MSEQLSNQQQKLISRIEQVRPHFMTDPWLHGYRPRPEYYHRLSLDWATVNRLAALGFQQVYDELGNKLFFTQSLLAGICLTGEKTDLSAILGTGIGKTYAFANINLIKAKRGEHVTAFSPDKELNSVIFRELSAALLGSPKFKSLIFDSDSKADALNKGASQRRFAFPSGGYVDLALAKNYTSVHSSVYLDEYSKLTDDVASGAQGRAGIYTTPDGKPGSIAKTSNPHVMNHSHKDMIRTPLSDHEAVVWGDYRLNVAEGVTLKRAMAQLDEEHAYLKDAISFSPDERDYLFDRVLNVLTSNSFFKRDGDDLRILFLSEFGINEDEAFFTNKPKIDDSPEDRSKDVYLGHDVAVRGSDNSIVARMEVNDDGTVRITSFEDVKPTPWNEYKSPEIMAENVLNYADEHNAKLICVDATGVGQGQFNVLNMLNKKLDPETQMPILGISFGDGATPSPIRTDYIGLHANRKRAEMYLDFRSYIKKGMVSVSSKVWEMIEPEYNAMKDLPDNDTSTKISVEPKSAIKQRLGRSPDYLDSCVLALHAYVLYQLYGTYEEVYDDSTELGGYQMNLIRSNNGNI